MSDQQEEEILGLPAPSDTSNKLEVNGPSVALDHLGPVVVNTDYTLSRISNWDKMSELEQQRTFRIVSKRNK